jgi:hypothetical protein
LRVRASQRGRAAAYHQSVAERERGLPVEADGVDPPQVWHRYRMSHSLNVFWHDHTISRDQMYALEDAWDLLVVHEEWRDWVRAQLIPPSPFLYLAVRDNLEKRRLLKAKTGVSMHVPAAEVAEAERSGELIALYLGIIRDIYVKWAQASGCPPPPVLPG